jgi:predicted RNA binding protein YcfA (HicA-like mRNA interferase family)
VSRKQAEHTLEPFHTHTAFANNARRVYHTQMSSADLIRELKKAGWQLARVNGSHHVFTRPGQGSIVVVPHPKKDLGKGLVKAIRQQAGI